MSEGQSMSDIIMEDYPKTELNIIKQAPKRAIYDRELVHKILDEALVIQVGFVVDGRAQIIPMYGVRDGEFLIFHGSRKSRFMKKLSGGTQLCLSVTHVDGLVFGRSAFHHSMNYRSVTIQSEGEIAPTHDKSRLAALVTDKFADGRYEDVRPTAVNEMKATDFLRVAIKNVVAKIRTGDPVDDKEDLTQPYWAGQVGVRMIFDAPKNAADLMRGIGVPQPIVDKYCG